MLVVVLAVVVVVVVVAVVEPVETSLSKPACRNQPVEITIAKTYFLIIIFTFCLETKSNKKFKTGSFC